MIEEKEIDNSQISQPNHMCKKDLCYDCKRNFAVCETCFGVFQIEVYFNTHKPLCKLARAKTENISNLKECDECYSMVKIPEFLEHSLKCSTTMADNIFITCCHCKIDFPKKLIKKHELECKEMQSSIVLINEKISCSICNEKFSIMQVEAHEKSCKLFNDKKDRFDKMKSTHKGICFPDEWQPSHNHEKTMGENVKLIPLDIDSIEYMRIEEHFAYSIQHLAIISVFRIQNINVFENYTREKHRIHEEKGEITETRLFYRDPRVKHIHICKHGFDISFAQDQKEYGRGIHFHRRAIDVFDSQNNENQEDKEQNYMFMANVLTGVPYVSYSYNSYRKPPLYGEHQNVHYDSVTNMDNPIEDINVSQTFVVYNNEKAYPLYMIEYAEINEDDNFDYANFK